MSRVLPSHPDLEQLKRQAKELQKAQQAHQPSVMPVLRLLECFTNASDHDVLYAPLHLHEAQYALAMDYGFRSWHALKQHVLLTNRAASPKLQQRDGRTWIPRIPNEAIGSVWDRQLRGLKLLLTHRGIAVTSDALSVISGEAFALSHPDYWHETTTLAVPTDTLANAANAFGLTARLHITPFCETMEEYEPHTLSALEEIRSYIDHGEPVMVGGVTEYGCGTWSVAIRYDTSAPVLLHVGLQKSPCWLPIRGIAFPCNEEEGLDKHWNAQVSLPYHGAYTIWLVNPFVTLEREVIGVDARQRALTVLKRSVDLSAFPYKPADHNDSVDYWFGMQAFEHIIADFERLTLADLLDTSPREAACRFRMIGEQVDRISRGRSAAAAFCETAMGTLPSASTFLSHAANSFRCSAALAQEHLGFLVTSSDEEKRQWFNNPSERQQAVKAYRSIFMHEQKAIENLARAVAASK